MTTTKPIDDDALNGLIETVVTDIGATVQSLLAEIGDDLGFYATLADTGPITSAELAQATGTYERYVREWLRAQAAGGYVTFDPETDRYGLSPEQALVLADEGSPAFMLGGFEGTIEILAHVQDDLESAFRTGAGIGWHEQHPTLFPATDRLYRTGYAASLVDEWIGALDGVDERLEEGGRVADVGCGYGTSTIIMAEAYPDSTFIGIDYHEDSVAAARRRAAEAGVDDRVRFEVATAKEYDDAGYDLVVMLDAFHDMGDPVGVARHVLDTLADDGVWMLVEPFANDRIEENLDARGRLFYAFSTVFCTPNALDQGGDPALGAQAGEAALRTVITEAGFTRVRRVFESPFDMVLEARP